MACSEMIDVYISLCLFHLLNSNYPIIALNFYGSNQMKRNTLIPTTMTPVGILSHQVRETIFIKFK